VSGETRKVARRQGNGSRSNGSTNAGLTRHTTCLSVRLVSDEGLVLSSNAIIAVAHLSSGRVWRSGRFHPPTQSYRFAGLPLGTYSVRATVAGHCTQSVETDLGEDAREIDLVLPRNRPTLLVLDVSGRMARYRALAHDVYTSAATRALLGDDPVALASPPAGRVELGLAARVHAALVADDRVVRAISGTSPRAESTPVEQWLRGRLAATFILPADLPEAVERAVAARVQLFLVVQAVFANPNVRCLVPTPAQPAVEAHALRVLGSIDHPRLEMIAPLLIRLLHPGLAAVDLVARSLTRTFPVAAPPCLSRQDSISDPPLPAATSGDEAPPHAETSPPSDVVGASFTLGRLAHLVTAGAALLPTMDGAHG
jgi:hypothetical protein